MKNRSMMLLSFLALISGCASLQVGSDVAAGRRAMLVGQNEAALAYFQKAAQADPDYRYGTALQQGIWSYVGRTEYAIGKFPQARETLERALKAHRDEDLTRLYLGLTLARSGDRQRGLQEIEGGMKGIHQWLDYINDAHRFSFGQFWDPANEIRSAIRQDLAMISGREFDWQKLITSGEWIAQRMEEESDKARRDEARERARESDSKSESTR